MFKIHTASRYGVWKCRSIMERILLLAVTLETDSARLVVGAKASTPYNPFRPYFSWYERPASAIFWIMIIESDSFQPWPVE